MKLTVLLVLFFITTNFAWAKTIARVGGKKGNAFVFYGNKQSASLKYGDKIADLSEIMVSDDSYLTLMNYEGHTYHLSGGTHVKFFNNMMEVKNGKVWVNSENSSEQFLVQSVNATAGYQQGQFIFSFSNSDGRTQLLVLDGNVGFSNVLEPQIVENVQAGFFSLVDKDQNNGLPRYATRIGLSSYTKMKLSFSEIEQVNNTKFEKMLQEFKAPNKREIASQTSGSNKGKLYLYDSENRQLMDHSIKRNPASDKFSAAKYLETMRSKKSQKGSSKKAKVRIFGGLDEEVKKVSSVKNLEFEVKVESARKPASIETTTIVNELNNSFESSLNNKIQIDRRHPEEVNQLINDLKSYDKNFKKNY